MASVHSPQHQRDLISEAITRGVKEAVERAITEEMAGVAERVYQRVRGETGAIAARVLDYFDMQHQQGRIIITVDFRDQSQGDR